MNVNDVESESPKGDKLKLIFERQKELKDKYHAIEESQGVGYALIKGQEFDINEIRSQCLMKDLTWRVVEEITEAIQAKVCHDNVHFLEELADALHFLTELCIMTDIGPAILAKPIHTNPEDDYFDALFFTPDEGKSNDPFNTVLHLGLAMNCLKNKPWKKTHILTDVDMFQTNIISAYRAFCQFLSCYALPEEMFDFYFRKSRVNDFRIKSNY